VFAWIGALFIGGTAWARMTVFAEPLALRPGEASRDGPQPVLTAATREGCVRRRRSAPAHIDLRAKPAPNDRKVRSSSAVLTSRHSFLFAAVSRTACCHLRERQDR
jgi:hypothetical protein